MRPAQGTWRGKDAAIQKHNFTFWRIPMMATHSIFVCSILFATACAVTDEDSAENSAQVSSASAAASCELGATSVENFEVPQDTTCTLIGTQVKGNLLVQRGGTLVADRISVEGNLQSEGSASVRVTSSFIGGSVQIKQGGAASVVRTVIEGDLQFDEMAAALAARYNTIGGSLQAFKNSGGLSISRNVIDGNLQCKENSPAPAGGGNTVQGNKEDQCANL